MKIALVIPYFGSWPQWIDLFFETVKRNESIDFIIYTDCPFDRYRFSNTKFKYCSFQDYVKLANQYFDFDFNPPNAYKLCDLRPFFGLIHEEDFKDYDFYGWCDLDLLFGDIRQFYTNDLLKKYDVFSTHSDRISGHFALFKNNERNRRICKKIYNWREALQNPEFVGIDEKGIGNAYTMTFIDKVNEKFGCNINNVVTRNLSKIKSKRLFFKEQYTTPFFSKSWIDGSSFLNHPKEWVYKDGVITNERDGKRNFIYIHFMHYKSSKWRHDNSKAPWEDKEKFCFATPNDMQTGVKINEKGIHPSKP